jgi:hypothetical protein
MPVFSRGTGQQTIPIQVNVPVSPAPPPINLPSAVPVPAQKQAQQTAPDLVSSVNQALKPKSPVRRSIIMPYPGPM